MTELEKECAALREACAKVEHMLQLTRRVNTKKINHLRKYTTWWINQMKTFTKSSGPGPLDLLYQNPWLFVRIGILPSTFKDSELTEIKACHVTVNFKENSFDEINVCHAKANFKENSFEDISLIL